MTVWRMTLAGVRDCRGPGSAGDGRIHCGAHECGSMCTTTRDDRPHEVQL
jgi:hypothetical protein